MDDNLIKNTDEASADAVEEITAETVEEENSVKDDSGNKRFRRILSAAVLVSFAVFVYLLIYFCENTGA